MKVKTLAPTEDDRFRGTLELDENGKIKGTYELQEGVYFQYSLTKNKALTSRHLIRGTVSLFDLETGFIMQQRGAAKRKIDQKRQLQDKGPCTGQHPTEYTTRHSIYPRDTDRETIKAKIAETAARLYAENAVELLDSAKRSMQIGEMSFALAVKLYGNRYANFRTKNADSQTGCLRLLRRVSVTLGAVPIYQLSHTTILRLAQILGTNWHEYVKEASIFLDFAFTQKKGSEGENLFASYLEQNPTSGARNVKKLRRKALGTDILSQNEEEKLDAEIESFPKDNVRLGMLLVKECCLSSKAACSLMWRDIHFPTEESTSALIDLQRDNTAGATKNYSFPISPFGTRVLQNRYEELSHVYPLERLARMPVLLARSSEKAMQPKDLTAACRTALHNVGVSYGTLTKLEDPNQGAGITLLQNTYRHRLYDTCGLKSDPTTFDFLQHKVLSHSVLADHYRCFTDSTARRYQTVILRRDPRSAPQKQCGKSIRKSKDQSGETVRIAPPDPLNKTTVSYKVHLKPGETITLSAQYGCKMTVQAQSPA